MRKKLFKLGEEKEAIEYIREVNKYPKEMASMISSLLRSRSEAEGNNIIIDEANKLMVYTNMSDYMKYFLDFLSINGENPSIIQLNLGIYSLLLMQKLLERCETEEEADELMNSENTLAVPTSYLFLKNINNEAFFDALKDNHIPGQYGHSKDGKPSCYIKLFPYNDFMVLDTVIDLINKHY